MNEYVNVSRKVAHALQVDCDFSIRLVHASAADLDLERLRGSEIKKTGAARYAPLMHYIATIHCLCFINSIECFVRL